jgi:DNA-binding winged helix-turn-helix (wHTH) protein
VAREDMISAIWQRSFVGSNVVDTIVSSLRKKLGPYGSRIATVPKAGYRFVDIE